MTPPLTWSTRETGRAVEAQALADPAAPDLCHATKAAGAPVNVYNPDNDLKTNVWIIAMGRRSPLFLNVPKHRFSTLWV